MSKSYLSFYFGLSFIVFILWILLTGSLALEELLIGIVVSIGISLATPRSEIFSGFKLSPQAPLALARYLGRFFVALIKANLDMARRVLSPSLPLSPEIVEVQTGLESSLGKLLLANSITLTPGTLTVDVIGDRILVHWVDSSEGADLAKATRYITEGFEQHIKGFLK